MWWLLHDCERHWSTTGTKTNFWIQLSSPIYETGINKKINFLYVHITSEKDKLPHFRFPKAHKFWHLLALQQRVPARKDINKDGTVSPLIHRTFKISSNWELFNNTINKLKLTFINNGCPNKLFDSILQNYLNKNAQSAAKMSPRLIPIIFPTQTNSLKFLQNRWTNYQTNSKRQYKMYQWIWSIKNYHLLQKSHH